MRLCRFASTKAVFHQSAQFGFLGVSAGTILGQVGFGGEATIQALRMEMGGKGCHWLRTAG